MPRQAATRPVFSFARGINSDANVTSFPSGFARDSENYELQNDESVRRRAALEVEREMAVLENTDTTTVYRTFKWSNVAEDPTIDFVVYQMGSLLYFSDDDADPVDNIKQFVVNLILRKVDGAADEDVISSPVQCVAGRGNLFVVGKFIEPFYVQYDPLTELITVNEIDIQERDFQGVVDGIPNTARPVTATASFRYNLLNAGWKNADIDQFFTDQSVYPSKNMVPWLAYRRTVVTGVAEQDGTKEFSSDKIIAELFQDAPAPRGHFIRTAFDTETLPFVDGTADLLVSFTSITPDAAAVNNSILLTSGSAHGLSPGDFVTLQIANTDPTGFAFTDLMYVDALGNLFELGLSGVQLEVITTPSATTFTVEMVFPSDYVDTGDLATYYAYVYISQVDTVGGFISPYRPTTVEFFAGRIWYAGTPYKSLGSKIFFTQVLESELQYGKCYQVADPTDENISDLVATDGGVLFIPEIQDVQKIKAYSSRLLIYASNGVWEVGPGAGGFFAANSYSFRKISDVGTSSPFGVCSTAEGRPVYWGNDGIYTVAQDTNTGYFTSQSVTDGVLSNLYNAIPHAARVNVQSVYDDTNKRIIWIYADGTDVVSLVLEGRTGGFFKNRLPGTIKSLFIPIVPYEVDDESKVKYIVNDPADGPHYVCTTTERTTYVDFTESTEFPAYILHGFDTAQAPWLRKYVAYMYVYSKRTEELLAGVIVNDSSTTLQARWDWSDNVVSGKWSPEQEVYRPRRLFLTGSSSGTLEDGYPVVVTKNKIRGRGRCVQFKLTAGTAKNSHILGFSTNFDVLTEK